MLVPPIDGNHKITCPILVIICEIAGTLIRTPWVDVETMNRIQYMIECIIFWIQKCTNLRFEFFRCNRRPVDSVAACESSFITCLNIFEEREFTWSARWMIAPIAIRAIFWEFGVGNHEGKPSNTILVSGTLTTCEPPKSITITVFAFTIIILNTPLAVFALFSKEVNGKTLDYFRSSQLPIKKSARTNGKITLARHFPRPA